jgi:serine/threonine protein kinase
MSSQFPTQPLSGGDSATDASEDSGGKNLEGLLAGRYQIFKVLGRGGFGVTYLARNVYLPGQPLCVIKHLTPKFNNPALMTIAKWRFYVEARTLSQLGSHSQIPLLVDYFRKDGEMYLVQEYIPGETIFQLVREGQCYDEAAVQDFLLEMLKLLAHVHSHRLVHRDVKPQNIIRCKTDDRLVLIDFGAVSDSAKPTPREREGWPSGDNRLFSKAIGTPGYAPPEQVAEQPVYASDLYALGMTCIFMLTGREPLAWKVDPQTCEVLWRNDVQVSDSFAEILNRMIRISLSDRYQSTIQVLHALENQRLQSKLGRYTNSKYSLSPISGDLEETRVEHLPPAVQWALAMSGK